MTESTVTRLMETMARIIGEKYEANVTVTVKGISTQVSAAGFDPAEVGALPTSPVGTHKCHE